MIGSIVFHYPPANLADRLQRCSELTQFVSVAEVAALLGAESKVITESGLCVTFDHAYNALSGDLLKVIKDLNVKPALYIDTQTVQRRIGMCLSWEEIAALAEDGWTLGAHSYTHYPYSDRENLGDYVALEIEYNDSIIKKYTGIKPEHLAYPSGTFTESLENEVKKHYKTARLWTNDSRFFYNDKLTSWSEFCQSPSETFFPVESLYITGNSSPYRLPGIETARLLGNDKMFFRYVAQDIPDSMLKLADFPIAQPSRGKECLEYLFGAFSEKSRKFLINLIPVKSIRRNLRSRFR